MLHTKIKEREERLDKQFGHIQIFKEWKSRSEAYGGIKAFNLTSSIELLQAVVEMIEKLRAVEQDRATKATNEQSNRLYTAKSVAFFEVSSLLLDEINKIKE